jgi:hypothetical protein
METGKAYLVIERIGRRRDREREQMSEGERKHWWREKRCGLEREDGIG